MGELILWGTPKGQTDPLHQKVLATQCRNQTDIDKVKAAASKDGWHSFRVQTLDGSQPDFAGAINGARRRAR